MTSGHLFVYGTLLLEVEHLVGALLRVHGQMIGRGTIQARLYDLGAYPGAIMSDSSGDAVFGEIYRVNEWGRVVHRIDAYEGCSDNDPEPHQFQRCSVPVNLNSGTSIMAWAYFYTGEPVVNRRISSGDYGAYLRNRRTPGRCVKPR